MQWEDEELVISGRKVLTLHRESQEWEIFFVVYLCSCGYICLFVQARLRCFCNTTAHGTGPAPESPQTKYSCDVCRLLAIQTEGRPAPEEPARADAALVQISTEEMNPVHPHGARVDFY